ncbi:MAG TPA: hypothetical protein VGA97_00660, partial [Acidimicrobiia bacterium]
MLLAQLVAVSEAVSSTRARSKKTALLADILGRLTPAEAPVAVSYLTGRPRQDRLGVGYATVYGIEAPPADVPSLEVLEVDTVLEDIAATSGPGSRKSIETALTGLLSRATVAEQGFLRGLILRNLRQGALEGVMADAVAAALGVGADRVRRAAMLEGDLVLVASRALAGGVETLGAGGLEVFTPVQPMLAKTADTAGEAVTALGSAVVEWKLDGARVQVHRDHDRVRIFTRNLRDVTGSLPELVEAARSLPGFSFILDGEALLVDATGQPRGFQDSMSSFGTDEADGRPPLTAFYFDLLHLDGEDLIDSPLTVRREALERVAPQGNLVGSILTADPDEADRVRRAAMLEGDLVLVASRALAGGVETLGAGGLEVFTPVQPMLAKTANTAGEAVTSLGSAVVEWKLDGARVQVHRDHDRVRIFTRNLRDVTGSLPELVEAARSLPGFSFILDGEALL